MRVQKWIKYFPQIEKYSALIAYPKLLIKAMLREVHIFIMHEVSTEGPAFTGLLVNSALGFNLASKIT